MTRSPDLVILCSRRKGTVTARVVNGVLITRQRGSRQPCFTELRGDGRILVGPALEDSGSKVMHASSIRCDCGKQHGQWAPQVLLRLVGAGTRTTTTEEVERLSREFWESL